MPTDPNTLVLNQILSEIQKLNNFEAQAQRTAQSLASVQRADAQTPVNPNLIRQAGPGAQLPGALSPNASTPDVLQQDDLKQMQRKATNQLADQQVGGQRAQSDVGVMSPNSRAEEAVAWSLLGEAGVGGPLGVLRQRQYSVNRNLSYVSSGLDYAQQKLDKTGWGANSSSDSPVPWSMGAMAPFQSAVNFAQNHELATTLGVQAISTGRDLANNWYEMGGRGLSGATAVVKRETIERSCA